MKTPLRSPSLASFASFTSFAGLVALTTALGCADKGSDSDSRDELVNVNVGLDQLTALPVVVERDGSGSYYPREGRFSIELPLLSHGCAYLDPSVTVTGNGQPPLADSVLRGGVSPTPGFFGGQVCQAVAGASFLVPDQGGELVIRFSQGTMTKEIAFSTSPLERMDMVAPASGAANRGDVITLAVPQTFYDSRQASPPTPHEIGHADLVTDRVVFEHAIFVPQGASPGPFTAGRDFGAVGVDADAVRVEIPTYAAPGAKDVYLTFLFSGDWSPMTVDRCEGFASCSGRSRDNLGVLGPVRLTVN